MATRCSSRCAHTLAHASTHQFIFDVRVPESQPVEVVQQVLVHHGELPAQDSAHVDVAGVGLKALVVA